MSMIKKVAIVFGTRPEGIKMSPVIKELLRDPFFKVVVINTAQHREMLDQVMQHFGIKTDYDLNTMKPNQSLVELSSHLILNLNDVYQEIQPDLVLVHGDTTTTLIGAYTAFLNQIPVGHVEAGLRTYRLDSPFPEELNRQLVTRLSNIHFACTEENRANLIQEQVPPKNIFVTGNTVIDALMVTLQIPVILPKKLQIIEEKPWKIILVTTHRRENIEELKEVYQALHMIVQSQEQTLIVFPVHKSPKVRKEVQKYLPRHKRILLVEPMEYHLFCHVMKRSTIIVTDSGGIQEEAISLDVPVLVTRNTTERPEGLQAGAIRLVGTGKQEIYKQIHLLLTNTQIYKDMKNAKNPYGDGFSARRIRKVLKAYFQDGE
ncbi:non-hydrolyzing UDP-N-acetylglucosamine 2-epimerase [Thermoactinomyces sp. DSM 45892]|uniref:non-hydrolyzing UDP-N-acetylglucosamine 2-epimerase n=1 Tax=Thermoactinomyces sp. DSM 45892 TaxID=1882753 RepID=UPI000B890604|nr:UDP-N-acetylglucosamine 2-epimerase (non-hydrolyzing) [Thermoactinomyces sp. DSM 45892]